MVDEYEQQIVYMTRGIVLCKVLLTATQLVDCVRSLLSFVIPHSTLLRRDANGDHVNINHITRTFESFEM